MYDLQFADLIPQTKMEVITNATATAALVSPFWLPWLKEASEIAAFFLPIAGLIWLIVQIVAKIYVTRKILDGGSVGDDE